MDCSTTGFPVCHQLLEFAQTHVHWVNDLIWSGRQFGKEDEIYSLTTCCTREGNGTPLQYSCLENPMDGGAWWAVVHGVAKSQTWLSDFTFTFHFHALEKEMATHSSVLAWRIPGTGEPGGLPSMGLHSRTRLKRLSSSSSNPLHTHHLPTRWGNRDTENGKDLLKSVAESLQTLI